MIKVRLQITVYPVIKQTFYIAVPLFATWMIKQHLFSVSCHLSLLSPYFFSSLPLNLLHCNTVSASLLCCIYCVLPHYLASGSNLYSLLLSSSTSSYLTIISQSTSLSRLPIKEPETTGSRDVWSGGD